MIPYNQEDGDCKDMNGMKCHDKVIITMMSGVEDGRKLEFEKMPVTFGRAGDNDLRLPYDTRISRYHAKITKEGDSYWLEDLKSTNGTHLDETRITGRVRISSGDIFAVGTVWLKFEEDE